MVSKALRQRQLRGLFYFERAGLAVLPAITVLYFGGSVWGAGSEAPTSTSAPILQRNGGFNWNQSEDEGEDRNSTAVGEHGRLRDALALREVG